MKLIDDGMVFRTMKKELKGLTFFYCVFEIQIICSFSFITPTVFHIAPYSTSDNHLMSHAAAILHLQDTSQLF